MKLIHIKIAGFKSFADPIHIPIPSELVGIVGPNGCGKSNVIDAARWVLGEMSAKQLRGMSMQDIIFNGSGDRNPVSRASVELIFDNSLGRVGGLWSKYSEISVKRIIDRSGESAYLINNQHVRRRDVSDMFLGTGLGGRGYAIIEQGMISRIIEAKPEELRGFLEEAAGTSKYRERRKETESRLRGTQDNLSRVEDIREELAKQVSHLENQAKMAANYNELQKKLTVSHGQLAKIRLENSKNSREKYQKSLKQAILNLEKINAEITAIQTESEQKKVSYEEASKLVDNKQKALYEVNAEMAKIEQQIEFLDQTQKKSESRLQEISIERTSQIKAENEARSNLEIQKRQYEQLKVSEQDIKNRLTSARNKLPHIERQLRVVNDERESYRQKLSSARQALELVRAKKEHSEQVLIQLQNRLNRLNDEKNNLVLPDSSGLVRLDVDLQQSEVAVSKQQKELEALEEAFPSKNQQLSKLERALEEVKKKLNEVSARIQALKHIQDKAKGAEELKRWLSKYSINTDSYLWESLKIKDGWEDALEAVLRERLNSIGVHDLSDILELGANSPPAKVSFHLISDLSHRSETKNSNVELLSEYVSYEDPAVRPVVENWLTGVYVLSDSSINIELLKKLKPGELFVTKKGHLFTSNGASYYAPDSELHGILSRQVEIENLEILKSQLSQETSSFVEKIEAIKKEVEDNDNKLRQTRSRLTSLLDQKHSIKLKHLRLTEHADRIAVRGGQIVEEIKEIKKDRNSEKDKIEDSIDAENDLHKLLKNQESLEVGIQQKTIESEKLLKEHQQKYEVVQKEFHQVEYEIRTKQERIAGIEKSHKIINENVARLDVQKHALSKELVGEKASELKRTLRGLLDDRETTEKNLKEARNEFDALDHQIRNLDSRRLEMDHKKTPLQESISNFRLQEQEASLSEKSFSEQIIELGLSDLDLSSQFKNEQNESYYLDLIDKIKIKIDKLGGVNLAAVEELQIAKDRKDYLDSQSEDLNLAVSTLVNAIKKIDQETKLQLQATFDKVNNKFGEMFTALFGGGAASLRLTDEQILSAGIQVMARPPGKKNVSIQSLSGGEKALTALSLVFALFQLNPAPFCLLDEVDAPLDDSNNARFCEVLESMSKFTQFIFVTHKKITMELANELVGVTMHELGVSKIVSVDLSEAISMNEKAA